jgi:hypothetical protein
MDAMRPCFRIALLAAAFFAGFAIAAAPRQAAAGESGAMATPVVSELTQRSDPCGFYRGQAYGRGLEHSSTEMLWACEAIALRRAAEMELSDRLVAVELALDRYRQAVVAAGAAAFVRHRARPQPAGPFGAGDAVKSALADSTGLSAALDAVREGY